MRRSMLALAIVLVVVAAGLAHAEDTGSTPIMMFNITSGPMEDTHAVTMALQLAGHALADGREVVLFFNVRGVRVPTKELPKDLAFKAEPISELLDSVMKQGAEVHVCPHCMKALDITAEDLIPGAVVTDREKLFSKIGSNTVVFSY